MSQADSLPKGIGDCGIVEETLDILGESQADSLPKGIGDLGEVLLGVFGRQSGPKRTHCRKALVTVTS